MNHTVEEHALDSYSMQGLQWGHPEIIFKQIKKGLSLYVTPSLLPQSFQNVISCLSCLFQHFLSFFLDLILFIYLFIFLTWPRHEACGILVP